MDNINTYLEKKISINEGKHTGNLTCMPRNRTIMGKCEFS